MTNKDVGLLITLLLWNLAKTFMGLDDDLEMFVFQTVRFSQRRRWNSVMYI